MPSGLLDPPLAANCDPSHIVLVDPLKSLLIFSNLAGSRRLSLAPPERWDAMFSSRKLRAVFSISALVIASALVPSMASSDRPWIRYSNYVGGDGDDFGHAIAIREVDPKNNLHLDEVYVGGETRSDKLGGPGSVHQPTWNGDDDGFVASLDTSLHAVHGFSYFGLKSGLPGGTGYDDKVHALTFDPSGLFWFGGVEGKSLGGECQTTTAFVGLFAGGLNFPVPTVPAVLELTGERNGEVFGVGVWPPRAKVASSAYVCGWTSSRVHTSAINPDAFQGVCASCAKTDPSDTKPCRSEIVDYGDAFVARLDVSPNPNTNPLALRAWSYLGAKGGHMVAQGIAPGHDYIYVTGKATGTIPQFANVFHSLGHPLLKPVAGFDNTIDGQDAFVACFDVNLTSLKAFTFLGGSGAENQCGGGIALDADDNVYVTGETSSSDFPTTDGSKGPGAFVAKFNRSLTQLIFSTVLTDPKASAACGLGIALAGARNPDIFACGMVGAGGLLNSSESAVSAGSPGTQQAFLVRLAPISNQRFRTVYATYLGNSCSGNSAAESVAVEQGGMCAYVTGTTQCSSFSVFYKPRPGVHTDVKVDPPTDVVQPTPTHHGGRDAFVVEVVGP